MVSGSEYPAIINVDSIGEDIRSLGAIRSHAAQAHGLTGGIAPASQTGQIRDRHLPGRTIKEQVSHAVGDDRRSLA